MSKSAPIYIRFSIIFLTIAGILTYIIFNTRIFIEGPKVNITFPENGYVANESIIYIEGDTHNTSRITVNDRDISIDEKGYFRTPVILNDGLNYILIEANDRFKRQVTKRLDVVYNIGVENLKVLEE